MTDFAGLTPDRVLAAVEALGLSPSGHCTPLTCLENRVYDVRLEDGRHVVVKFYRPDRFGREAILAEHRFLDDLADQEIPVCAPLRIGGETLHRGHDLHHAVWPRTGGRAPDEFDDDELAVLGRLLARIHNVGASRDAPERPRLDPTDVADRSLAALASRLPSHLSDRYRALALEAASLCEARSRGVPKHRIHGDCHAGNLLRGPQGWFFLDFDDFVVGPAVHDVWMLLPGRDAFARRQRAVLVAAYRSFRDFDERWLDLVEPLRALRFVWYAAWIARRWHDPAFRDAFPHFGGDDYWEGELRDLEALLAGEEGAPDAGAVSSATGAAPEELTNEDLFWDL